MRTLFVMTVSFIIFCSISCFAETIDKIAVVVNDQTITASEVEAAIKPVIQQIKNSYSGQDVEQKIAEARKEVIGRLVEEKLILQEAKQRKIEVKNEEVEEILKQIRSRFANEQAFQSTLKSQGMTLWELKKAYKEQIMVKKMVRQFVRGRANITPAQILDYYQSHVNDYKLPNAVSISQILIKFKPGENSEDTQRTVEQVEQLLVMGADFATIAKKYSEGPNAQGGGDIGFVEKGAMAKQIDDVIFNMKEGEVSKPIETTVGFAIVKINSIRTEQQKPLDEVKNQIEEKLLDDAAKTILENWVKELKEKAYIQIKG